MQKPGLKKEEGLMERYYRIIITCGVFTLGLLSGCASVKVTRTEVTKTVDLSGRWNDTDSRLVSEEMIKDCLARPWLGEFTTKAGKSPYVIVGGVLNRSSEHIDAQLFIKDLEADLLNSGKVKFVASKEPRQEIREERADQTRFSSKETAKAFGRESGADFMLQGTINSVTDELKGKSSILYQVNLELVNLETNEKAWIGQKKIKKIVSRSAFGL